MKPLEAYRQLVEEIKKYEDMDLSEAEKDPNTEEKITFLFNSLFELINKYEWLKEHTKEDFVTSSINGMVYVRVKR